MLEIMTERCCLRPMTDADFPALCRYLQDPGVMYAYGHAFSDREVWDWLRRQRDTVPWPWSCGKRAK